MRHNTINRITQQIVFGLLYLLILKAIATIRQSYSKSPLLTVGAVLCPDFPQKLSPYADAKYALDQALSDSKSNE
jgi:hypothetical protein